MSGGIAQRIVENARGISRKDALCRYILWSMVAVQARFEKRFRFRHYPTNTVMYKWVSKFRVRETVSDLNVHVGRSKAARSLANINVVRDSVGHNPRESLRHRSEELGIPRESIRRILVQDLQLYLYRIQFQHQLIATTLNNQF